MTHLWSTEHLLTVGQVDRDQHERLVQRHHDVGVSARWLRAVATDVRQQSAAALRRTQEEREVDGRLQGGRLTRRHRETGEVGAVRKTERCRGEGLKK